MGRLTLDQQRQIIATAARTLEMIIVAESVDYGRPRPGLRPGLSALVALAENIHISNCVVVDRDHFAVGKADTDYWRNSLALAGIDLYEATEV
jgi:DNA invertase Pin-like site-specific DNA recombinase